MKWGCPLWGRGWGTTLLAATLALLLGACAAPAPPRGTGHHPATPTIDVSPSTCGHGWARPRPGIQTFALRNTTPAPAEARLQDARTGAVLGEVEGIGPGGVRLLTVRLGPGAYSFVCRAADAVPVAGPAVRVGGHGTRGPAVIPVTRRELIAPALAYQRWVGRELGRLVRAADALAARTGDVRRARAAWLAAHLRYQRLGAAYGAFGDRGEAVDRTAAGLPGGIHDPRFTGFRRVEYGLWHGERGPALRRAADRLASDVRALHGSWAETRMDPAELARRAHEIVEDTLRLELTGRGDHGSGTSLATARAQLDGSRRALDALRPALRARGVATTALDDRFRRARSLLDRQRRGGRWTPLARLGRADRERIDACFGDLAERLAVVAAVCDVRSAA
ncbi:EfeM/EfeO family lipoprotein [Streptomyces sp. AV19]|uniref:EfeM/EfeO family lipoprotein n=1 Tax=Streptomyces sp. AV19 TaxID=2793068 RepID=UPI00241363B5|nr:EfeM/EfeO family lipoprotein [Streptomyces sp. AV19]MDG4535108.1 EfeM/EfeO family lipoprotein [Streptomyces sp. AV19]